MSEEIKVVYTDPKIRKARAAIENCNLTSHELVKMLGVIGSMYYEALEKEADDFRRSFS